VHCCVDFCIAHFSELLGDSENQPPGVLELAQLSEAGDSKPSPQLFSRLVAATKKADQQTGVLGKAALQLTNTLPASRGQKVFCR
jgi:hypothetical protein